MKIITKAAGLFALLTVSSAPTIANDEPYGCYQPVRGFAVSICTDSQACTTQAGIYRLTFRNDGAPRGERWLVVSGTFRGVIPNPGEINDCGGASLNHVLMDKDMAGTIITHGDQACPTGGDGIRTLEVVETLNIAEGTGIYEGVQSGGQVTLVGKLGLKTGINTFRVSPSDSDEVCFF